MAAGMSVASSYHPIVLVAFFLSLLQFGVFSWLHFFTGKVGAIAMLIGFIAIFFTGPFFILRSYLQNGDYLIALYFISIPVVGILTSTWLAWHGRETELKTPVKWGLVSAAFVPAAYIAFQMIMKLSS